MSKGAKSNNSGGMARHASLIGQPATVAVAVANVSNAIWRVPCVVTDYRAVFGRIDYQVKPVGEVEGAAVWVESSRVREGGAE